MTAQPYTKPRLRLLTTTPALERSFQRARLLAAPRYQPPPVNLEEAQRFAHYAWLYSLLALYHATSGHALERVRACTVDAERCRRFAVAIVFGPGLEQ